MIYSSTITKTGQVFLPKAVRTALNLLPGERVTITTKKDNTVEIKRQKTLDEFLKEWDASMSDETRALIKKNAGKTARELREEWMNSEEGKRYYREKYGPNI